MKRSVGLLVAGLVCVGCTGADAAVARPSPVAALTEPVAAATSEPSPTATPEPTTTATPEPQPTAEPTPEPTPAPATRDEHIHAYQTTVNTMLEQWDETGYWSHVADHTWPPGGFDADLLACLTSQNGLGFENQPTLAFDIDTLTPYEFDLIVPGAHPGSGQIPDGDIFEISVKVQDSYTARTQVHFDDDGKPWFFYAVDVNAEPCL